MLRYELPESRHTTVLVTNKHVLENAVQIEFHLARYSPDEDGPALGGASIQYDVTEDFWVGHPNPAVDVAAMFFNVPLETLSTTATPAYTKTIPRSMLLTAAQADDLDAIESVTFVGYPVGLFDTHMVLPIARRGHTATPIYYDYRGEPAFLIDASVFPGSSGSPVFVLDSGMHSRRDGGAYLGGRIHLLGIVAAVHTRQVSGLVNDLPTAAIATFQDVVNLGIVFKASAIQETVDVLFTQGGLAQADSMELI